MMWILGGLAAIAIVVVGVPLAAVVGDEIQWRRTRREAERKRVGQRWV